MKNITKKISSIFIIIIVLTSIFVIADYLNIFSKLGINVSLLNLEFWGIYFSIISGLIGGIIALIGVVITIKDNNEKYLDNERRKFVPWVNYCTVHKELYNNNIAVNNTNFGNKLKYKINDFLLSNTDFSDFVLKAIVIDENICKIEPNWYIRKNATIRIYFEKYVFTNKRIENIYILSEDLLGNEYKIQIDFKSKDVEKCIQLQGVGCFKAEYKTEA